MGLSRDLVRDLTVLVVLALFFDSVSGKSCANNGPVEAMPGPAYKLGVPTKNVICPSSGVNSIMKINVNSCYLGTCWSRGSVPISTNRLRMRGRVIDEDCNPIPNAMLDFWQTDYNGYYGSLFEGEENGYCRARLFTDEQGQYEVETDLPGAYGLFGLFAPPWFPVLPPYLPQHIHLVIYAPGHDLFSSQLYLPDDASRQHDLRKALSGVDIHADNPRNVLNVTLKASAWETGVDFVLHRNPRISTGNITEAILRALCTSPPTFNPVDVAICVPQDTWKLQLIGPIFYAILLLILGGTLYLAYVCCFARKRSPQKTKKE